ncbi:MAG: helix-turn-helix domain-containing protein [Oenococcus sp.]
MLDMIIGLMSFVAQLAKQYGIARSTVYRIMKRIKETTTQA